MRNSLSLAMCICLLASPLAHAHNEPVPLKCLAPNTVPVLIKSFAFSPAQLTAYQTSGAACASKFQTCGGVDEYFHASRMAQDFCAALTPDAPDWDKAQPTIASPSIFNDQGATHIDGILKHHDYRFSGGLSGSCYVCKLATD
ncbi:MAG: hypothetical protein ABL934_18535 [Lysobacteraceae bacterium]